MLSLVPVKALDEESHFNLVEMVPLSTSLDEAKINLILVLKRSEKEVVRYRKIQLF